MPVKCKHQNLPEFELGEWLSYYMAAANLRRQSNGSILRADQANRFSITTICCAGVFTGTNRIVGLVTSSQIASASAEALCPRFKGFICCAGVSRTSWPRAAYAYSWQVFLKRYFLARSLPR